MNAISNYYNKYAPTFLIAERRKRKTLPLLDDFVDKKVLDVGCASGYIGEYVKKRGNYVVGLDIHKKNIKKAKKKLDEAYVLDIENDKLNVLGKNYDLIIMVEVMEHLFDPENTIKRLLPLLKPKGKVLLSTPNFVHIYNRIKIMLGIYRYKENTLINKSHLHFYTYDTFAETAKSLGLCLIMENHVYLPVCLEKIIKFWPNLFVGQMVAMFQK